MKKLIAKLDWEAVWFYAGTLIVIPIFFGFLKGADEEALVGFEFYMWYYYCLGLILVLMQIPIIKKEVIEPKKEDFGGYIKEVKEMVKANNMSAKPTIETGEDGREYLTHHSTGKHPMIQQWEEDAPYMEKILREGLGTWEEKQERINKMLVEKYMPAVIDKHYINRQVFAADKIYYEIEKDEFIKILKRFAQDVRHDEETHSKALAEVSQTSLNRLFKIQDLEARVKELEKWERIALSNRDACYALEAKLKELMPCSCSETYKSRQMDDPDCARCNYLDEILKIINHERDR